MDVFFPNTASIVLFEELKQAYKGNLPVDLSSLSAANIREGGPEDVYGFAITSFLPSVVGNLHWRSNVSSLRLSEFTNFTDEVLLLFLLENSLAVWDVAYTNKTIMNDSDKEDLPRPKYTEMVGRSAQKYSGWNRAGLERWNKLSLEVYKARRNVKNTFDLQYLEYAKENWNITPKKVRKEDKGSDMLVIDGFTPEKDIEAEEEKNQRLRENEGFSEEEEEQDAIVATNQAPV